MERQNQTTYTFDFNAEVARARENFPEETRNVTFIDASQPDALKKMHAWALENALGEDLIDKIIYFFLPAKREKDIKRELYEKISNKNSLYISHLNGKRLLVCESMPKGDYYQLGCLHKTAFKVFQHELGHVFQTQKPPPLLTPPGHQWRELSEQQLREKQADTFALLTGLSRGILDRSDAEKVARTRLAEAVLHGGISHITTDALEGVILDKQDIDFTSLSPADIRKIATEHTQQFKTPVSEIRRAHQNINLNIHLDHDECALANTCPLDALSSISGFRASMKDHFNKKARQTAKGTYSHGLFTRLARLAENTPRPSPKL